MRLAKRASYVYTLAQSKQVRMDTWGAKFVAELAGEGGSVKGQRPSRGGSSAGSAMGGA